MGLVMQATPFVFLETCCASVMQSRYLYSTFTSHGASSELDHLRVTLYAVGQRKNKKGGEE